jgi:DNA polymerase IIIc chi subunit
LCATFQKATVRPRSFVLNQWTIVLPQGGQPIPFTQPFSVCSTTITVSLTPTTSGTKTAILHVLSDDLDEREAARLRWRHYAQRGYTIRPHEVAG